MDKNFNNIIKRAQGFSLTKKERSTIITQVSLHIEANPLGSSLHNKISPYTDSVMKTVTDRHKRYNSGWSTLFTLSTFKQKKFMPIVLTLMLLLSGGTSLAANNALPGDILYPVKVNVNENVRSLFALTTDAKIKVESSIANERLQETEKLAVKGHISADEKNTLTANFSEHADKVKAIVADLKAKGNATKAAKVNSDFETSLIIHQRALSDISKNDTRNQENINDIATKVNIYLGNNTEIKSVGNSQPPTPQHQTKEWAETSQLSAANKISEVEKYIKDKKDISAEIRTQAVTQMNIAREIFKNGKIKLEAQAYADAYALFANVIPDAQKAKLIIDGKSDIKIHVDDDSSINKNLINLEKNTHDLVKPQAGVKTEIHANGYFGL